MGKPEARGLTKEDVTLLALASADGNELTPIQLQKSVFLFQKMFPVGVIEEEYEFIPYNYGPFCSEVYDDARSLSSEGLVQLASSYGTSGYTTYAATSEGIESGKDLASRLRPETADHARRLVDWVRRQSFGGLVKAIYDQYPEFQVNSIFQG
jgi:uncharacterized protein